MNLIQARKTLYMDYCHELDSYDPEHEDFLHYFTRFKAIRSCKAYMKKKGFEWIDIYNKANILIGFLIIGRDLSIHGEGLYICEAYIMPEERSRGYMSSEINNILKENAGNVYMEIFDLNKRAVRFWRNRMSDYSAMLVDKNTSFSKVPGLTEYHYYIPAK